MTDVEKTIKELEALYNAMHENRCYACSHEFVELAEKFGTEIIADAIETIKTQQQMYWTLEHDWRMLKEHMNKRKHCEGVKKMSETVGPFNPNNLRDTERTMLFEAQDYEKAWDMVKDKVVITGLTIADNGEFTLTGRISTVS